MIEKIKDSTTCPHCGKTSHDMLETLYLFGLRKMKDWHERFNEFLCKSEKLGQSKKNSFLELFCQSTL